MTKKEPEQAAAPARREVKQNLSDKHFAIAMLVLACIFVPFLIGAAIIYNYGHEHKPPGYKYPEYKQLWMTAVGAVTFSVFREMLDCIFDPLWRYFIPHKGDEYLFEKKVAKAKRNFTGFWYFLLSTYWGYITIKDSKWLPWFLGGQNPEASLAESFVPLFPETPPGTHCYILFTYGYHVQDFFRHLAVKIEERDNDWREMFLHHVAAVCLYPGFMFSNVMGVGVVLAWLHDIADISVNAARLFLSLDLKILAVTFYVAMITSWFYTRLMILPYYIYEILLGFSFPEPVTHFNFLLYCELTFLMIMQVLHVHWFILFMKMGQRFVTQGKAVDLVNDIDQKKEKKAE